MGVYESIMKLRQRIASPAVAPKEATAGATSQTPSASSAPQAPESPTAPSGQFRAKGVQVLGIPSPEDIPDGISVIEKMQPGSYRSPVPVQSKSRPKMSYTELFEKLGGLEKPETVEQRRQREKKQKRENVMSAISDGISSLANLFFTTRGAPDSFNPSNSMLARTKERWDKINADRQANDRAYYEAYVRARAMDDADEKDQRNWQHTLDREKIADSATRPRRNKIRLSQHSTKSCGNIKSQRRNTRQSRRGLNLNMPSKMRSWISNTSKLALTNGKPQPEHPTHRLRNTTHKPPAPTSQRNSAHGMPRVANISSSVRRQHTNLPDGKVHSMSRNTTSARQPSSPTRPGQENPSPTPKANQ